MKVTLEMPFLTAVALRQLLGDVKTQTDEPLVKAVKAELELRGIDLTKIKISL